MATANPTITAADIINDVDIRVINSLSSADKIPWVSYAYQRVYGALATAGQEVKEDLFGAYLSLNLDTDSPNEYSVETAIPRFGGFVTVQVKYGASGDEYKIATRLRSVAHWTNWDNISTTYRSKQQPLYYKFGDTLGFIPVPPESGAVAKIFYIKRPNQIEDVADEIDIPYRFIYPIIEYVQAKTIQRVNEDYREAELVERNFERQLEEITLMAASEDNENDGTDAIEVSSSDEIFYNPLR